MRYYPGYKIGEWEIQELYKRAARLKCSCGNTHYFPIRKLYHMEDKGVQRCIKCAAKERYKHKRIDFDGELLHKSEIAEMYDISPNTVYKMFHDKSEEEAIKFLKDHYMTKEAKEYMIRKFDPLS